MKANIFLWSLIFLTTVVIIQERVLANDTNARETRSAEHALVKPQHTNIFDLIPTNQVPELTNTLASKNWIAPTNDALTDAEIIQIEAEQGKASAQFELAESYRSKLIHAVLEHNSQNTFQAISNAVVWFRKAAEQGHLQAQKQLAYILSNGGFMMTNQIQRNLPEAAKWYLSAAMQGDADSQSEIGMMYANGKGLPQNVVVAVKWYRRGALQGNPAAENNLGVAYLNGQGVPINYIEAYKWLSLASAQEGWIAMGATIMRDNVAKQMTTEQIAEGQRLATAFVPREEGSATNTKSDSVKATGTGFFITDDGYFISNNHVVKDATQIRIVTRTGTVKAKVIQTDAANDLALLKAEGKFSALPVAPSHNVKLGNTVATVGFPDPGLQGFAPKFAKGEIASLSGAGDDARYFQISVPVQPGNSGGALVDARGNVVGIVSAKLNAAAALASSGALPENVNYAVKSSFLLGFLEAVPDVASKLKEPNAKDENFEDVVKSAQDAAALVLVY